MLPIYILNGPNLNLLGQREPDVYGTTTLADIEKACAVTAKDLGFDIVCQQSNSEGNMVDHIQEAISGSCGLIINAAAYTHTSLAIGDALRMYPHPSIEVHLSNIYQREALRHHSYVAPVVSGGVFGLGAEGYQLALRGLASLIANQ